MSRQCILFVLRVLSLCNRSRPRVDERLNVDISVHGPHFLYPGIGFRESISLGLMD